MSITPALNESANPFSEAPVSRHRFNRRRSDLIINTAVAREWQQLDMKRDLRIARELAIRPASLAISRSCSSELDSSHQNSEEVHNSFQSSSHSPRLLEQVHLVSDPSIKFDDYVSCQDSTDSSSNIGIFKSIPSLHYRLLNLDSSPIEDHTPLNTQQNTQQFPLEKLQGSDFQANMH